MNVKAFDPFAIDAEPFDADGGDPFELYTDEAEGVRMRDLYPRKGQHPYSWLACGQWGSGKTSFAVGSARIELEAMERHGKPWKVWANIEIAFAERCDPWIVKYIGGYPADARDLTLVLDEVPSMLSSAGWNSKGNQGWRRFNEQIRKRNIHLLGTAISALEIDRGYARLLNLIIRCKAYGKRIALFVHDHFGYITGQPKRGWPPLPGEEDWRRWFLPHPELIDGMFDSNEIVVPMTAENRAERIAADPRWDRMDQHELDGVVDKETRADRETAMAGRQLIDHLQAAGDFKVSEHFLEAAGLFPHVVRDPDSWRKMLEQNGFNVYRPGENKPFMARYTPDSDGWDAGP